MCQRRIHELSRDTGLAREKTRNDDWGMAASKEPLTNTVNGLQLCFHLSTSRIKTPPRLCLDES